MPLFKELKKLAPLSKYAIFNVAKKAISIVKSRISDPISRKFYKTINNLNQNSPFEIKFGLDLDKNMSEKMLGTDF